MSNTATWLHGQRKTDLVEIAEKVGLHDYESLKKADLETVLDEYMRKNQTSLEKDTSLAPFFKRLLAPSPVKVDSSSALVETKTPKAQPRKSLKAKETLDSATESISALVRNPRLSFAANVPLPPSPSVVASEIERQTSLVRSRITKAYAKTGIVEYVDSIRDRVSTTASIESIAIAIELFGLQPELLPVKYLALIPASKALGTPDIPARIPDLFVLLTAQFWSTFSLWATTSVLLPLAFAYFFNLTLKAKHGHVKHGKNVHPEQQYDSLTFNISKGLIMWLVYGNGVSLFGIPSLGTKARIESSVPLGYQGVMVAAGVGALTSVYEAVLKK